MLGGDDVLSVEVSEDVESVVVWWFVLVNDVISVDLDSSVVVGGVDIITISVTSMVLGIVSVDIIILVDSDGNGIAEPAVD